VSFIDDYSNFVWLYLLHHKSEVFPFFKEFQSLVEHIFNRKVVVVQRAGEEGEYECLNSFFCSVSISHLVSYPHTHQ
jgi:hypothetical protein